MKRIAIPMALVPVITFAAIAALVSVTSAPASANTGVGQFSAATDDFGIGTSIQHFLSLLQGPIAQMVAVILVLVGIFLYARGNELHEGVKTMGAIALGLAVIMAIPTIMGKINGGNGSELPRAAHVLRIAHSAPAVPAAVLVLPAAR